MPLQSLQDMLFHKHDIERYPSLVFNDTKVQMAASSKHFGLILDFKLDFNKQTCKQQHLKKKTIL